MRLIVEQSLAAGFISKTTWQQRALLPFKPGVLERKVYNNDDITFFSTSPFAKPECDNELQPISGCTTLSYFGVANVNTQKRMLYPLNKAYVKWPLSKRPKTGFQDQLSLNAGQKYCRMLQGEHSAILSTIIKLPFVIKISVFLSIFEWLFYTGSTVLTHS